MQCVVVDIDLKICKGCGICARVCPKGVIRMSERIGSAGFPLPQVSSPEVCSGCMLCELLCPDLAITVLSPQNEV